MKHQIIEGLRQKSQTHDHPVFTTLTPRPATFLILSSVCTSSQDQRITLWTKPRARSQAVGWQIVRISQYKVPTMGLWQAIPYENLRVSRALHTKYSPLAQGNYTQHKPGMEPAPERIQGGRFFFQIWRWLEMTYFFES